MPSLIDLPTELLLEIFGHNVPTMAASSDEELASWFNNQRITEQLYNTAEASFPGTYTMQATLIADYVRNPSGLMHSTPFSDPAKEVKIVGCAGLRDEDLAAEARNLRLFVHIGEKKMIEKFLHAVQVLLNRFASARHIHIIVGPVYSHADDTTAGKVRDLFAGRVGCGMRRLQANDPRLVCEVSTIEPKGRTTLDGYVVTTVSGPKVDGDGLVDVTGQYAGLEAVNKALEACTPVAGMTVDEILEDDSECDEYVD